MKIVKPCGFIFWELQGKLCIPVSKKISWQGKTSTLRHGICAKQLFIMEIFYSVQLLCIFVIRLNNELFTAGLTFSPMLNYYFMHNYQDWNPPRNLLQPRNYQAPPLRVLPCPVQLRKSPLPLSQRHLQQQLLPLRHSLQCAQCLTNQHSKLEWWDLVMTSTAMRFTLLLKVVHFPS